MEALMSRDGSGGYDLPYPTFTPNTLADADQVTANNADIITAIAGSLAANGEKVPTANQPMGSYKHTGVAQGTALTEYADVKSVQNGTYIWCGTAGGTADAITLTPSPAITAYVAGQKFRWKAGSSANTGAATVAISGLTTKALELNDAALAAGDHAANKYYEGLYDGTAVQITRVSQSPGISTSLTRGYTIAGNSSGAAAAVNISAASTALVGDGTDAVATGIRKQGLETVWIPAGAMVANTTNGAASGLTESTTNKVMNKTLDFDTSTQEFAQFTIRFPKSWNEGTVTFEPVWTAASGSGGVVWALQGVALSNDDAIDTAYGTEQTSTDTLITASDVHVGPASSAITIAGTPAAGDWVSFKVKRNVSDGSDTLGVDALLMGVVLIFTTNAGDDT